MQIDHTQKVEKLYIPYIKQTLSNNFVKIMYLAFYKAFMGNTTRMVILIVLYTEIVR